MSDAPGRSDELHLFREFSATRDRSIRNLLVEQHMGLAAHIAARFRRPNVTDADLRQVAMVGLVKAVDRFDPDFGGTFASFAGPTIEGEIKRHFRDRSWVVRVPRSAKELHLQIRRAGDELLRTSGRSPTVDELARHLGIERDDVLRGLSAGAAYDVGSIDASRGSDAGDTALDRHSFLAVVDSAFEHSDNQSVVNDLLERLPEREREIVRLSFYENLSQAEIGEVIGISQMHVSRLLRQSFDRMRAWLDDGETPA